MEKYFIKSLEEIKNFKTHDRLFFLCENCGVETSKEMYVFKRHNYDKLLCGKCQKIYTCINKYGVINVFCKEDIKEKAIKSIKSEKCINKRKKTNLEKYGNICSAQGKEQKLKRKQTCLQKYGTEYSFQNENVKNKIKETKIKRYGHENPSIKNVYKYKDEYFDSSYELYFYIYCVDNDIEIKRNYIPYKMDNGHKCYPDFLVNGQLVEIKSRYLTNKDDWKYKEKCYKENNIKVLFDEDIIMYKNYVNNLYGSNYIKQFIIKKKIKAPQEEELNL